jgi:serine/threonine protein kinase
MSVTVFKSGKEIKLTDKDYLSEGGEGKIYIKSGEVFKIYHEINKVIPEKKVKELLVLDKKNIISPKHMIYDSKSIPVGYTMDYINDTVALPRIFTTSFRDRTGITPESSIKLVEQMMETIQFIHDKKILIVDMNEFNFLVDSKTFKTPYFIDVDSYQTQSFPATAIMLSIKDWQSKDFNEYTDWYSFAIISCQIFVGIHPFKGTHPSYNRSDLEGRMKANVSIFNKDVSVPSATREFDLIPDEIKKWYIDLFEKGKRTLPPSISGKIIAKAQQVIISGLDKFMIDVVYEAVEKIIGCNFAYNNRIIFTNNKVIINKSEYLGISNSNGIVFYNNIPISIDIDNGSLVIEDFIHKSSLLNTKINANKKFIIDNRAYYINNDKLTEINFETINNRIFPTFKKSWNILPNSISIYRNIIVSDVLGKAYLYIPFKEGSCQIIPVKELDGYRIIDAKYDEGIAIFLAFRNDIYNRIIIKFNSEMTSYSSVIDKDVTMYGVNFATLPSGVAVILTGEDTIEIISRYKDEKKIITNCGIDSRAILCNEGNNLHFFLDKKLYKIKMK